jgi:carboxymethylenebutenolidase
MATMTSDPDVIDVPVLTGGRGTDQLHDFYRDWFIPSWPDDVEIQPLSRTIDDAVVDEFIVRFTQS